MQAVLARYTNLDLRFACAFPDGRRHGVNVDGWRSTTSAKTRWLRRPARSRRLRSVRRALRPHAYCSLVLALEPVMIRRMPWKS